jgi:hypothetical protein
VAVAVLRARRGLVAVIPRPARIAVALVELALAVGTAGRATVAGLYQATVVPVEARHTHAAPEDTATTLRGPAAVQTPLRTNCRDSHFHAGLHETR